MSSNVFFIDDDFSRKMSKAFISFVEENITNNSKDITIVVDSVGGDSVDATLMSHWLRKRRGSFTAINVVVLGNCMSAAFDFVVSVKDIAAISTRSKYIVAINTGPIVGCLNIYSLDYVKKWIIFDICIVPYSYPTFVSAQDEMDIIKNIKL